MFDHAHETPDLAKREHIDNVKYNGTQNLKADDHYVHGSTLEVVLIPLQSLEKDQQLHSILHFIDDLVLQKKCEHNPDASHVNGVDWLKIVHGSIVIPEEEGDQYLKDEHEVALSKSVVNLDWRAGFRKVSRHCQVIGVVLYLD